MTDENSSPSATDTKTEKVSPSVDPDAPPPNENHDMDEEAPPDVTVVTTETSPNGTTKSKTQLNGVGLVQRARFSVHRDALDQQELEKLYSIDITDLDEQSYPKKLSKKFQATCKFTPDTIHAFLLSVFPFLTWLPQYNFREHLFSDVTAGFTIAILHIPQGMAYGLLASVDAIVGLYVSFFPVLIYFFMGTSRHISLGTFAVISLMLSSAADQLNAVNSRTPASASNQLPTPSPTNRSNVPYFDYYDTPSVVQSNNTYVEAEAELPQGDDGWPPTRLEVLTTMCLVVGVWQILMGIFRLGALTVVLSDQLVSGFSTGAAVHVATSQMKDLFDIRVRRFSGPFKIVYSYIDIFGDLFHARLGTIIVSATALFILAFVKEQVNTRFQKKLAMPIPIDLIVVVLATAVSHFGDFNGRFGVKVMGYIPTGLPEPQPPRMDLIPNVTVSSLVVAVVAFAISLSMAKIFAKKHKYVVSPNQELIALGTSNIISSFFLCYPCSASLSRSVVQERSGCKTQVASLVSCAILLVVLLVMGPLFYTLPKCILASIILVALKGMFMQISDFKKAWRISKSDAMIWLVSFASVVLIDVDYGLIIGVIFSLLTVLVQSVTPHRTLLGNLPSTDIYLDIKRYKEAKEIAGVKIFHFGAALYFANREVFKSGLAKFLDDAINLPDSVEDTKPTPCHHLIIDCSSFSYLDCAGVETLIEVTKECKEQGVAAFLAGCSVPVYDRLEAASYFTKVPQPSVFPTIHDAVLHCQKPQAPPEELA